jgi:hypothetical protein
MKLTHVTAAAVCIGMMLVACQKDKAISGIHTNKQLKSGPEQGEDVMAAFFADNRAHNTEFFKVFPSKGGDFVTEEGTQLHVDPNVLRNADGSEINGWVTIAVLDNYTRGEAAMNNMPAEAAMNPDQDDNGMLATAGSFDFDFKTEDGGDVINPEGGVSVQAPAENFGDPVPDPEMKLWDAGQSADQDRDITWEENGETPEIVGGNYKFNIEAPWNQINLDKRLNGTGPYTQLTVDLPAAYNQNNAEVFVFFSNATTPTAPRQFASMDVYDFTNQWWGEHLGYVNVGDQIYIVGVGVLNNTLHAEVKPVTVSVNSAWGDHEVLTNLTPTNTLALKNTINNLP